MVLVGLVKKPLLFNLPKKQPFVLQFSCRTITYTKMFQWLIKLVYCRHQNCLRPWEIATTAAFSTEQVTNSASLYPRDISQSSKQCWRSTKWRKATLPIKFFGAKGACFIHCIEWCKLFATSNVIFHVAVLYVCCNGMESNDIYPSSSFIWTTCG